MAIRKASMKKTDILKENGTFNHQSDKVTADDFRHGIFFDPQDLVQVKYEMLRSVAKDNLSVSEASKKYGLSRQTYYINKEAVEKAGIMALIPQKPGPKHATKLTDDGKTFIDSFVQSHPKATLKDINEALAQNTGITVHLRTIQRYLSKKLSGS